MEQRLTIITLGVEDLAESRAFYARLGWEEDASSSEDIAFFDAGGIRLALFGRAELAEDAHVDEAGSGFRGVTLAYNTREKEQVDAVLGEAVEAGAELVKPAEMVFWGGYSGYFADPDGHLWEVAWNPHLIPDA
jgi:hypothetical protein